MPYSGRLCASKCSSETRLLLQSLSDFKALHCLRSRRNFYFPFRDECQNRTACRRRDGHRKISYSSPGGPLPPCSIPPGGISRTLQRRAKTSSDRVRNRLFQAARPDAMGIRITGKKAIPGGWEDRLVLCAVRPYCDEGSCQGKFGLAHTARFADGKSGPVAIVQGRRVDR